MIYFEEVLPESVSPEIRISFKIGVAIYGFAGERIQAGTLEDVKVAANEQYITTQFEVASTGNAHVRMNGKYAVWRVGEFTPEDLESLQELHSKDVSPASSLLSGYLPAPPVLAGTRRVIPLLLRHSLKPGDYVMGVYTELGEEKVRKYTPFTVPLEVPLGVAAR
jgi:hypothetical protein